MTSSILTRRRGIQAVRATGSSSVPQIVGELTESFERFRKANDERYNALEKGVEDALRAATRFGVGGGGGGAPDDVERRLKSFKAGLRDLGLSTRVDADTLRGYIAAESQYWRLGGAAPPDVQAALHTGSDAAGGFLVSPDRSDAIRARTFDQSPMRQLATVETTTSDVLEVPVDSDDIAAGGWVAELGTRGETATPRVGLQKIEVHEQFAQPHVSQRLLEDADRDLDAWLTARIADKFARTEGTAFINGNGVGRPRGILSYAADAVTTDDATRDWGVLQYVPSGAAGGFPTVSGLAGATDADALVTMTSKLKPVYRANARWLMNRSTAATLRTLRDADGRYLWQDGLIAGAPAALLGFEVVTDEGMPAIASDSFSIAFGDFRAGYTIADRRGITVLRDPFTSKGVVKFYATQRVGGDVTDSEAVKLLKFAVS